MTKHWTYKWDSQNSQFVLMNPAGAAVAFFPSPQGADPTPVDRLVDGLCRHLDREAKHTHDDPALLESLESIVETWRDSDSENELAFELSEIARKAIAKARAA